MSAKYETGWIPDPDGTEKFRDSLRETGPDTAFGAKPGIRGHWERLKSRGVTAVFTFEAEKEYARFLGTPDSRGYLDPWCQRFGYCVGAGGTHALQTQYLDSVRRGVIVGEPRLLSWEFTYSVCRQIAIRKRMLGSGGGAYGAHYAQAANETGLLPRGRYGSIDLTSSNETLGYRWSQPGGQIPRELYDAAQGHTARCMFLDSGEERNDALAAGYCYGIASWTAWGRGRDGLFHPAGRTAHQEHDCGICVLEDGRDVRIRRNSHCGKEGPVRLRYAGGEIDLPLGAYPVLATEEDRTITRGAECWAYDLLEGWRPGSLADAARNRNRGTV